MCLMLMTHPRIVNTSERRLRLVEDEEGGEVGGVGGHDYHGEASPHHPQHPSRKASGSACKKERNGPEYRLDLINSCLRHA